MDGRLAATLHSRFARMKSKKEELLAQIDRAVKTCHGCRLWRTANHAVPGEGSPGATIMFVGEGPGYKKDKLIGEMHGRGFKVGNRIVFPLYHPAAALRSPAVLRILEHDFRSLPKIIRGELAPVEIEVTNGDKNQMKLI